MRGYVAFPLLLLVLLLPGAASGQGIFPSENGKALAGIKEFDAYVVLAAWLGVEASRDQFAENAQTAFELALRRDGVTVGPAAPNYLVCNVAAAQRSGIATFSYVVRYYTYSFAPGVPHRLEWESGGIVSGGAANFTSDVVAKECADAFAHEWLKQNPKR